jgi:predicted HTH transcriptional regulator/NAD-dependent SIR2 family protein deacetylase
MEMQEQDIEHLIGVIANGNPKPILLLGAGASVRSGIPATGPFVDKAAAWVYARRKQLPFDDVRIRRSDWLPFLESQQWYNSSLSPSENYPAVFKHLLTPRELRREFYRLILNPKIDPSTGYRALSEFVAKKYFNTFLTTNFDNLLNKVFSSDERIHTIDVIKSLSDYSKISTDPKGVQIIHLHGDVDNYTDKNDIDEIQDLNKEFIQRILPLLSDHPLIVVGYRGYENSIMKTLLIENASYTTNYKHGIYWCILEHDDLAMIPDNLKLLHATIGNNLQFIRIKGFDDLFDIGLKKGIKQEYRIAYRKGDGSADNIFDLRAIKNATLSQLDLSLLRLRIVKYCQTLRLPLASPLSDNDLKNVLLERDLLVEYGDFLCPTNSGMLLFGRTPQEFIPHCTIKVEIKDSNNFFKNNYLTEGEEFQTEYIVHGNLWNQLNTIIEIVSIFNKPYKLKGEISTTVTPYPPLAIKELLTNCIVHRNYDQDSQTLIEIHPKYIRIVNSGGLVEDVQEKLEGAPIEDVIKQGGKGIKGYRNPVLADLFYGTETMEKRGSGLADVFHETQQYASQVKFGPDNFNENFEAIIYARPEIIDEITNTAKNKSSYVEKYSSNICEIIFYPEYLHVSNAICTKIEIMERISTEILPPFVYWNQKIITFFDHSQAQFGFSEFIDKGTMERFRVSEFCSTPDTERKFVELLNLSFMTHLAFLGLRVDIEKRRAFFEKSIQNDDNVQIRYQARIKSATRTVVKKRVSSTTGRIIYWEHKSFSFRIERFSGTIGLLIIPNYTFTSDGFSRYVKAEKINILSTKRASKDYNIHYLNDLSFWIWVLTQGGKESTALKVFNDEVMNKMSDSEKIVLNNDYVKGTRLSEELFDDYLNEEMEDFEDLYDDVDKIALSQDEELESGNTFNNEE